MLQHFHCPLGSLSMLRLLSVMVVLRLCFRARGRALRYGSLEAMKEWGKERKEE